MDGGNGERGDSGGGGFGGGGGGGNGAGGGCGGGGNGGGGGIPGGGNGRGGGIPGGEDGGLVGMCGGAAGASGKGGGGGGGGRINARFTSALHTLHAAFKLRMPLGGEATSVFDFAAPVPEGWLIPLAAAATAATNPSLSTMAPSSRRPCVRPVGSPSTFRYHVPLPSLWRASNCLLFARSSGNFWLSAYTQRSSVNPARLLSTSRLQMFHLAASLRAASLSCG